MLIGIKIIQTSQLLNVYLCIHNYNDMSDTATFKGKIKLVAVGIPESESYSRNYFNSIETDFNLPDYYKSYTELIIDDYNHVLIDDNLYQVLTKESLQNDDIFEASKTDHNVYDYLVQYYDGGCSFSEAIGYALKNVKVDEQ